MSAHICSCVCVCVVQTATENQMDKDWMALPQPATVGRTLLFCFLTGRDREDTKERK